MNFTVKLVSWFPCLFLFLYFDLDPQPTHYINMNPFFRMLPFPLI